MKKGVIILFIIITALLFPMLDARADVRSNGHASSVAECSRQV